jgi:hypothetical protein
MQSSPTTTAGAAFGAAAGAAAAATCTWQSASQLTQLQAQHPLILHSFSKFSCAEIRTQTNNSMNCTAPVAAASHTYPLLLKQHQLTLHSFSESGISPRPSASRSARLAALRLATVSCKHHMQQQQQQQQL